MGADSNSQISDRLEPTLEHVLTLDVEIAEPIEIGETGDGQRRIIPITGGTVDGRIQGEILDAGADFQVHRIERSTELVAKYAFESDDGSRVYVENQGIRYADPETSRRLRADEPVDPDDVYFKTVPTFETADPELEWLTQRIFVAAGTRQPDGVTLAVYAVE